jgi:hypothetical protein
MGNESPRVLDLVVNWVQSCRMDLDQKLPSPRTGDVARANFKVTLLFEKKKSFLLRRHAKEM